MSVAQTETDLYRHVWALEDYGAYSPGERFAPMFREMVDARLREETAYTFPQGREPLTRRQTVLDAGAGSGKGAVALADAGFAVTCCDCTDDGLINEARALPFYTVCLWRNLCQAIPPHDWVFCCDVMEHIPTAFTMLTAQRLLDVSIHGVFFSISLVPDGFGVWVGHPLHQTVQPFTWWKEQLGEIGTVSEARDCLNTGVYLVTP